MTSLVRIAICTIILCTMPSWGFFAHQKINRHAVFILPVEMIGFYKHHIQYLADKAVNPDKRRYILPQEAARHYIDLDVYGDSALEILPKYWNQAVSAFTEDTLRAYGIVPWHIQKVKNQLTRAFERRDIDRILRYSADLGHYIADAHVPLHTTENYNGQLTGQHGIHGFWESRLPELFYQDYDLFTGKAEYLQNTQSAAWDAVAGAHAALDSVLTMERLVSEKFAGDKYSFEERGNQTMRVYSYEFSKAYHDSLNGMVNRQMKKAIKAIASFWYTSWVDGGQPNLNILIGVPVNDREKTSTEQGSPALHESGEILQNEN